MASRLDDVQRALRWVRANAAKSAVDGLTRTFAKELGQPELYTQSSECRFGRLRINTAVT